ILIVIAAQGIYYRLDELPENRRYLEENKQRILAERGWTEDSFGWRQFSRKVERGEMVSFYTSPNTTAAMIATLALVVAALAVQRIWDRDEWGWPAALLLILLPAGYVMFFTGSRAGYLTPLLGALLMYLGFRFGGRIASRRLAAFLLLLVAGILAAAAVVAHGAYHGSLFHDSLTFRWKYWVGSARVFVEHWLAGVGYGNFGLFYLTHRLPEAAEEIKDPHNLLVRAFVELGIVGGALMVGWLIRLGWETTSPIVPAAPTKRAGAAGIGLILGIALLAMIVNAAASIDFSISLPASQDKSAYIATELLRRTLYLGLMILVLAVATIRSRTQVTPDDRPAPWLLMGMIAAIAIFFLHSMIDFAFFESGPMHVVALLSGALIGVRAESVAGRRKWNRASQALTAVAITAWLVAALGFVIPLADAERRAQAADEALRRGDLRLAVEGYRAAFDNTPVSNADYAWRAARALILENRDRAAIDLWLSLAIATNPRHPGYRIARAAFAMSLPAAERNISRIMADYSTAIALDPNNVPTRLAFARALEDSGNPRAAVEQYRAALQLNDRLDPQEPKRLSAAEVAEIRQKIEALEG
ncbi:MAG: O-antigen ligase family protein, partial [Phycisphaerae bacterium]|nr:O-antigen ligase family protein [Phycisphaerae bacterium]